MAEHERENKTDTAVDEASANEAAVSEAAVHEAAVDGTAAGTETRNVRVGYQSRGYGLALVIDDAEQRGRNCGDHAGRGSARCHHHGPADDTTLEEAKDAVLRVGAAVVTLEIPTIDGRPAVLAWDPAEVDWEALTA